MLLQKGALLAGAGLVSFVPVGAAWGTEADAAVEGASESEGDQIIVTGARSTGRTVQDSPTPIDVLSEETLREANDSSLLQSLNDTLPSFSVPNLPGYGINSFIRAGQLRGLSSGHILILVNGKRRHVTARLGVNDAGAAAADLGLIPLSTISRIEVLRDGASAIYGSDAIAGVINVITKKDDHGGELRARAGQYYGGGGLSQQYDAGIGFNIGGGHLYLSAEYARQDPKYGETDVPSNILFYFPTVGGVPVSPAGNASTAPTLPAGATADPREATVNRRRIFGASGGVPEGDFLAFTADLAVPLSDGVEFYSFADFSRRAGRSAQHYRFPSRDVVVRALWPDGFTPYTGLVETNFSVLGGLRGQIGGWDWDLSSQFGQDNIDAYQYDSNNPSYGLASQRDFYTGNYRYTSWTSNLDFRKTVENGLFGSAVDWSFGGEFRRETYRRLQGDLQSWSHGGVPILDGPNAGKQIPISDSGSQADTGLRPEDEARDARNVYAVYAGLSLRPSERFTIDLAGRYENIQKSGDVVTGRVSARYDITDGFALRGTVSTGFQAPALAAQSFRTTGVTVNQTNHTLAVTSAEAQALGAKPLQPEKSTNFSAGFTAKLGSSVNLAVDLYQVTVRGRISALGTFRNSTHPGSGVLVQAASPRFGPDDGISYLINAGDTRTRGIDVVLDGRFDLAGAGNLRWSLAANYNKSKFVKIADTPAVLSAFNITLISAATQATTLYRTPELKVVGALNWSKGPFSAGVRGTYYGKLLRSYTLTHASGPNTVELVDVGHTFVTDLDLGYDITERLKLGVNISNLFSAKPKQVPTNATSRWPFLTTAYVQDSPINPLGGFYSATLSYRW